MAIKQIKDYQQKYDIDLIGTECFIIQEQSGNISGITKRTTLLDIMNKTIEYTYSIEGPDHPYPYKETLSLNELILIKDPENVISGNNITSNHVKYTKLNDIKTSLHKMKEFIHEESVTVDFSKYSYIKIRLPSDDPNLVNNIDSFVSIEFINFSLNSVQEITIECINFHNKQISWLQPNIKWSEGAPSYTPIKEEQDANGNYVVKMPSIDLIKIISIEGKEFYGYVIARDIY